MFDGFGGFNYFRLMVFDGFLVGGASPTISFFDVNQIWWLLVVLLVPIRFASVGGFGGFW